MGNNLWNIRGFASFLQKSGPVKEKGIIGVFKKKFFWQNAF
jgi:hypothetical protein